VKAASQEVKHSLRDVGWGCYDVVYTPMIAVPHKIAAKYNGVNVSGSPVEVNVKNPYSGKVVTASGLGLHQSRVGKPTTFVIETLGHHSDSIDVWVTGPSGSAVPVKCYQQKDGNLLAEFNANVAGAHKIEVR
jgi:filamin